MAIKVSLSAPLLMFVCACGPSRIPSGSDETTSDSSTDDPFTTGTPAETEDTSDTSPDTSTEIVPNLDDMLLEDCDPFAQDCPDGEKCVPYSSSGGSTWDANKCVPVMGDQALGEPCVYGGAAEGTDDCDATSMCWNLMDVDGELVGECAPFCLGSVVEPECPEGMYCPIAGDGVLNVCIPKCDPVAQDCDDDFACYWVGQEFACVDSLANLPVGEPCEFLNDCAPGLMCVSVDYLPACTEASCCAAFCDIALGDMQCEAVPGTSCVSFFEVGRAPPEYEHVGVCVVP
jgi:hypothetical protein